MAHEDEQNPITSFSDTIPERVGLLELRMGNVERVTQKLRDDVDSIKTSIPTLATKTDMTVVADRLSSEIHTAIFGILRDAIASYPAKTANGLLAVSALAAVGAVAVPLILFLFHVHL